MDEAQTKPTLETILAEMRAGFAKVEARLEKIETLLDRTASVAYETRAGVRDLKKLLREQLNLPV